MSIAYQPPQFDVPIDLDLSRNEGAATVSVIDLPSDEVANLTSRYPDTTRLSSLVAGRHGIGESQVLVTAGGDDALFRCLLHGKGPVVATTPSFEMIGRYATQLELPHTGVPWWDGAFPVTDFVDVTDARTAVIVSPNNPTGSVVTAADLRKVADVFSLVVLDAAYVEFAEEDLTPVALEMDNVVVIRTLSKAFGLAGLRVGYLLGPEVLVNDLRGFGSPYALSALSARLAGDVLEDRLHQAAEYAAAVTRNRERLVEALEELGAEPLPSQGNFVLATHVDPNTLVTAAGDLGVALRGFPGRSGLESSVRMTVPGQEEDLERLIETLRVVLGPRPSGCES